MNNMQCRLKEYGIAVWLIRFDLDEDSIIVQSVFDPKERTSNPEGLQMKMHKN